MLKPVGELIFISWQRLHNIDSHYHVSCLKTGISVLWCHQQLVKKTSTIQLKKTISIKSHNGED